MASTEKTSIIGLSKWLAGDKPKRADFVADNEKIDQTLGGHISNASLHLTEQMRERLQNPVSFTQVTGSGSASRSVVLDFEPLFVAVFAVGKPPEVLDSSVCKCYSGFASQSAASIGVLLDLDEVRLYQNSAATDGVRACMNESGVTYVIAAFK